MHLTRYFCEILILPALENTSSVKTEIITALFSSCSLRDDIHIDMNISRTRASLFRLCDDLEAFLDDSLGNHTGGRSRAKVEFLSSQPLTRLFL